MAETEEAEEEVEEEEGGDQPPLQSPRHRNQCAPLAPTSGLWRGRAVIAGIIRGVGARPVAGRCKPGRAGI